MTVDRWSGADAYEAYVGRWSRQVARLFVSDLDVPAAEAWVDLGCGTGALSGTILELADPASVLGVDPSADFVAAARAAIGDPRASFVVGDGTAMPLPAGAAGIVVSGLVLNFIPDLGAALVEMDRVTRVGGRVAAYVWDYADRMELMRRFWDAASMVAGGAVDEDEATRFPVCSPDGLRAAFEGGGVTDVTTWAIEVPTVFADFDAYWRPFESGVGAAPAYAVRLPDDRRAAIRDHLRATIPTASDGSIHLVARAWAARGRFAG